MRRSFALTLLAGAMALAFQAPAWADTMQVGTSAEAWYRGSLVAEDAPFCILPCPQVAAPEPPRPEDTLHVGVSGGREVARTYFELDLSGLPRPVAITGGTVRLPLAGADAGTTGPELADLVACAVAGPVRPAEGGPPDEAPPVDCSKTATLELDEAAGALTFDLGPFIGGQPGETSISLAVIPSEAAKEEQQTWRVAFHGRERDSEDAEPISAEIQYTATADPGPVDPGPQPTRAPFEPSPTETDSGTFPRSGPQAPPPFAPGRDEPAPVPPVAASPAPAPSSPDGPPLAAAPGGPIAYPQVWLLPLLFIVVGASLVRSLSAEYVAPAAGITV